jgi:hypothetical protein
MVSTFGRVKFIVGIIILDVHFESFNGDDFELNILLEYALNK